METEPRFLDFQCPYCGEKVSFPEDTEMRLRECPNCLASMVISDEPSPTAEKVPLPIVTPRLILRRLERGDWKDLLEAFGDEQLFDYVQARATTQEQVVEWIEKDSYTRLTVPNTWFCLALQHREKEKVIGDLQWFLAEDHSQAAFEVYVRRDFQRQG